MSHKASKLDYLFFRKYSEVCKITDNGLLFRYLNAEQSIRIFPYIIKQQIDTANFSYLGFQNTLETEYRECNYKSVGFFQNDYRFRKVCNFPWNYTDRFRQYKYVLSPDISCFTDMPVYEQWLNTYHNRLIGAYWQHYGLTVIPTVSWSDERSYNFCFSGIEKGSVLAVSTIGTKIYKYNFMAGFKEMCRRLKPPHVICYCTPYPDMYNYAGIIPIEHEGAAAKKLARLRPIPGQIELIQKNDIIFKGGA